MLIHCTKSDKRSIFAQKVHFSLTSLSLRCSSQHNYNARRLKTAFYNQKQENVFCKSCFFKKKKTLLSDNPIIDSAGLSLNKFKNVPKEQITNGVITSDVQTLNIYYPLQKQMNEEHTKNIKID